MALAMISIWESVIAMAHAKDRSPFGDRLTCFRCPSTNSEGLDSRAAVRCRASSLSPKRLSDGAGALLCRAKALSSPPMAQLALHHVSSSPISCGRAPSIRTCSASRSLSGRPSRALAPGSPAVPSRCI